MRKGKYVWSGESRTDRHRGPDVTWTEMPADTVQQYLTSLLVGWNCNIHYCWCDVTNTHDCWLGAACVLVQYHIIKHAWWWRCRIWWAGGITWPLFSETSTYMPADLVLFNQTCLLVHWKSKRKSTWPMPHNQTCQLTLWTLISQTAT